MKQSTTKTITVELTEREATSLRNALESFIGYTRERHSVLDQAGHVQELAHVLTDALGDRADEH